jgi:hypothetical protein
MEERTRASSRNGTALGVANHLGIMARSSPPPLAARTRRPPGNRRAPGAWPRQAAALGGHPPRQPLPGLLLPRFRLRQRRLDAILADTGPTGGVRQAVRAHCAGARRAARHQSVCRRGDPSMSRRTTAALIAIAIQQAQAGVDYSPRTRATCPNCGAERLGI